MVLLRMAAGGCIVLGVAGCGGEGGVRARASTSAPAAASRPASRRVERVYYFDGIRTVELEEDETGIRMTIRAVDESAIELVTRYNARSAAELERQSYDAFLMYRKAKESGVRRP